ncbi:Mov34/MPN/PAD-1 family protein [Lacinutrix sp. MedPE-SW]|uniref:Mov34/MPN/PAD-1 family protein n=1 Tax=Lacinutrix sp. MedPE-SW TaxID=1860087 RepID=UPI0025C5F0CA|nr:Mov34/MPN/PAD-1 family protein [Lacinutrix sp. MedPE-SW]
MDVEVQIPKGLLNKIVDAGIKMYPKEYGGFLIGFYSEDFKTLHITETILPSEYRNSKYSFERSAKGIKGELKRLYSLNPKQHYVGEWHTHPDNSTQFSITDLNAMIEIAECKTVGINNPTLMILSINKSRLNDFEFYVYNDKKLLRYE